MPSLSRLLSIVVATAALAGCGSTALSPSAPPGPSEPAVWLPVDVGASVPAAVVGRRPLPFCGVEKPPRPQPGEFIDPAVRLCFLNAHLARREAEFVSIQSTIEGGTIATIYRLAADGRVQMVTDFTNDPFGGGGWQLTRCAGLVGAEGNALFGVTDCGDSQPVE